jgi:hypothetical protein
MDTWWLGPLICYGALAFIVWWLWAGWHDEHEKYLHGID